MKRIYQLLPFVLLIAMLFAGCGSPANTTAPAGTPTPEATTAPATTAPAGTDAPASEPTGQATAAPGGEPQEALDVAFGAVASLNGAALQVTKVETSAGDDVDQPAAGKEFVIVTVAIKNVGSDVLSYSPYYFKLRNGAGQEDDAALVFMNSETALDTGELLPGGMATGTVVFEEPKGDTKLAFIYQDAVLSEDKRITVDLSDTSAAVQAMTPGEIKAADIPTVNQGEENKLGAASVTLNKVTRSSGDEYTAPRAGTEFVIVEVTVKNTGSETLSCGPFDFKMRNSLGQQSSFTQVSFLSDELESADLAPGASVTGTVAFDEPAGDAGLMLVYQQLSLEKTDYVGFAVK